jgi:uncharacterized protein (DUF1800 family)
MPVSEQLKYQHLLWRAGFGPNQDTFSKEIAGKPASWYKQLETASASTVKELDVINPYLKTVLDEGNRRMMADDERRMLRRLQRDDIRKLNLAWLTQMVKSDQQLREKMSLFWHGHFACRSQNIFHQQALLNTVRSKALGNFGDLLRAVSKSPAMLNFLNNNQNRKGHPNENFAREVMELFTMGRGHYTENDVKEAARAFTGWGADQKGEFFFRKQAHDSGTKTFLQHTGNFDGDQVLDILLEQKATANFIAAKVYRFFVNEVPDEKHVQWLAERFYASKYNISNLMKDIFTADWFYDDQHIGTRIKSPVELIAGIRRVLAVDFKNEEAQLLIQRLLGQLLLYPPNVAGWPGGTNWIDSSSLMFRLRIPQLITDAGEIAIRPKDDDDQMMGMMESKKVEKGKGGVRKAIASGYQLHATVQWDGLTSKFSKVPREALKEKLKATFLQTPSGISSTLLENYADNSSRTQYIKTIVTRLMSTPEYQLC